MYFALHLYVQIIYLYVSPYLYVCFSPIQNGNKSKKPTKILAASSPLPSLSVPAKKPDHLSEKKISSRGVEIISGSKSSAESSVPEKDSNILKAEDVHQFLKPIPEPDITNKLQDTVAQATKTNDLKTVQILNAVKPSDLEWHKQAINLKFLPQYYKSLSKFRLTGDFFQIYFYSFE